MNDGQENFLDGRVLAWFSCGAPSACAARLGAIKYRNSNLAFEILNCDTLADENPDNARFMRDVSEWIGLPIKQIRSTKYRTVDDVFAATRYMSGPDGARCTLELKKAPRIAYQCDEDLHIWGYALDEGKRIAEFQFNNPELRCEWILRDAGMTESDCRNMIEKAGIELPENYRLGYEHNNCRGCVKATSPHYWNKVRKDYPMDFAQRVARSRELGVRLVRYKGERIFLDQLPPDSIEQVKEDIHCGPVCNPVSV